MTTAAGPARIVVGVDGSAGSRVALAWAINEAQRRQAELDVVLAFPIIHPLAVGEAVVAVPTYADQQKEAVERLEHELAECEADLTGLTVHKVVQPGGGTGVLCDVAKGATMLVVGSRGWGGFSGLLLGSVPQQLLHHAGCPVVVVPIGTTAKS